MISIQQFAIAVCGVEEMSDRLEAVARLTSGNIVEIGGGEGLNTIRFIKIAKEQNRKVITIDPFDDIPGADESYFKPYPLEKFSLNVGDCTGYLSLLRLPSQHESVQLTMLKHKPVGFVFIDGLQTKEAVLSDLRLAESLDAEIICVDDYDRLTESSQVPLAVREFTTETNYTFIDIGKREAYFIKQ